jgi:hypothetical protein
MKMLVSKMANLPKDSEESVINANKIIEELKALESEFDGRGAATGNQSGVVTGETQV